jgi:hypothetical protein
MVQHLSIILFFRTILFNMEPIQTTINWEQSSPVPPYFGTKQYLKVIAGRGGAQPAHGRSKTQTCVGGGKVNCWTRFK